MVVLEQAAKPFGDLDAAGALGPTMDDLVAQPLMGRSRW